MPGPPIHILGLGNLGKLLAHSLRKNHPDLPIILLFHREDLYKEFDTIAGRQIEIVRNGVAERQGRFGVKFAPKEGGGAEKGKGEREIGETGIGHLIVATKTYKTVEALAPWREGLGRESEILFLQNGMGTIDEVTNSLFRNPATRPAYLTGIFNHGVYGTGRPNSFSATHAGLANAFIGPAFPSSPSAPSPSSAETKTETTSYLTQTLTTCADLATTPVPSARITLIQLQKLTANAVINPLTALFQCANGALFASPAIIAVMHRMIAELSAVLTSYIHSHLSLPAEEEQEAMAQFSCEGIREHVWRVGEMTRGNTSSMRQDVSAGRATEIEYINGWVVRQGKEMGLGRDVGVNERVVGLVRRGGWVAEGGVTEEVEGAVVEHLLSGEGKEFSE